MSELIKPTLNLAILLGVMVYYLREPLKQFVFNRHSELKGELARVRDLLQKAKAQYEEFNAKLGALDAEITTLKSQATQDAHAARQRILSEAQKLSTNIATDARHSAEALFADLRGGLYAELSAGVLDRSEALLRERLTGEDRARIQKEFSVQLETTR